MIKAIEAKAKGNRCPMVVKDLNSGEFVGSSSFYNINETNLRLSIGYTYFAPKFQ